MSQSVEGATWEAEAAIKARYPHLFSSDSTPAGGNSSSSLFQSFMREFSLTIMFPQFLLAFSLFVYPSTSVKFLNHKKGTMSLQTSYQKLKVGYDYD